MAQKSTRTKLSDIYQRLFGQNISQEKLNMSQIREVFLSDKGDLGGFKEFVNRFVDKDHNPLPNENTEEEFADSVKLNSESDDDNSTNEESDNELYDELNGNQSDSYLEFFKKTNDKYKYFSANDEKAQEAYQACLKMVGYSFYTYRHTARPDQSYFRDGETNAIETEPEFLAYKMLVTPIMDLTCWQAIIICNFRLGSFHRI